MQRQPPVLPVYDRCELVGHLTRDEYAPRLRKQELRGVGSRRALTALHIVHRTMLELRGPVPKQKPTSYLQHVGVARVWQHSNSAKAWLTA